MRHLIRLNKPKILEEKQEKWTRDFINNPEKKRPDNSKYGHKDIKETLGRISFKKCFYSEVKFAELSEAQVDHYIEVTEDKNKAFDWDNLYLSHKDCNQGKTPNTNIPNSETLNPFLDSDEEIEKNLYFEDEITKGSTEKGRKTIQKYNLDKDIFNTLRLKKLQEYTNVLQTILGSIENNPSKTKMSDTDKETLMRFTNTDQPFSLMFKFKLKKTNFL